MSEELNEAIAWLTEHIDMREHVRSERAHDQRKHLESITAARARIAELEAQAKRIRTLAESCDQLSSSASIDQCCRIIEYAMQSANEFRDAVVNGAEGLKSQLVAERTAHLATQRALVDLDASGDDLCSECSARVTSDWRRVQGKHEEVINSAYRAVNAQADGKEAV